MTPPQHRALERIIAGWDADPRRPMTVDRRRGNSATTVHPSTAEALVGRGLARRVPVELDLTVVLAPTDDGRALADTSTPIGKTR